MTLPTEPIGSIPRPAELIQAVRAHERGELEASDLPAAYDRALRETIAALEATGSPVITDGEQTKPSFATYPIHGLEQLAPGGVSIPFEDGHERQLPYLTAGPFRYGTYADTYLEQAQRHARVPIKQAVIAPSALSLLYPEGGIDGYPRDAFLDDLVDQAEADVRRSLARGAHAVQIDFTEGRLAVKLDPSHGLLDSFIELNRRVLERFSDEERRRIGIHTCPGADQDAAHSLDVDYAELLPSLLGLEVGNVYVQLASEADHRRVLGLIRQHMRPDQRIFVGVIDPIDPRIETADEVRDRVLEAAELIPPDQLGTCDDCGFAPFGDDTSTPRETAFAKIRARVEGTQLAADQLGG